MCVYTNIKLQKQIKKQLKEDCEKGYGWCPNSNSKNPCDVCGGVEDVLLSKCYNCDACKQWGNTQQEEDEIRRL